jgi:arsenite methyltransferase
LRLGPSRFATPRLLRRRARQREAYRVLAPGRLAISDAVSTAVLSPKLLNDPAVHAGCIAGASPVDDVRRFMSDAGFIDVQVTVQEDSRDIIADWSPGSGAQRFVAAAALEARKPR